MPKGEPYNRSATMSKWFRNILAIVILAFLLWYLARHWQQLQGLLRLTPNELLLLYTLFFLQTCFSATVSRSLLSALDTKTNLWHMILLQNASILLNYVPMKFGTLFRANYLKHHYGLRYSHFATFFLYLMFWTTAAASVMGIVIVFAVYGWASYENKILAAVFIGALIFSIVVLFFPLPAPTGSGQLRATLGNFIAGRQSVSKNRKVLFVCTGLLGVNFLLQALRMGIIYSSMGQDIKPWGCLILGALGFITLLIGITPGALGIRELVLGSAAIVLDVSPEAGLLAAMIDRAIMLSFSLVLGGISAAWLWRKSPQDFRKQPNTSAPSEGACGR